jgi:hypothetical protein
LALESIGQIIHGYHRLGNIVLLRDSDHPVTVSSMGTALAVSAVAIGLALVAIAVWAAVTAAAGREFEREIAAWTRQGDVITVIRKDVYERSGRLARLSPPPASGPLPGPARLI